MALSLHSAAPWNRPAGKLPAERRSALRFGIGSDTACHLIAGVGETLWPARVLDLSTRGAALLLRRRFEPGAHVIVELANGVRVFSCALLMHVIHATALADGSYVLGGEFARKLGHDELMALLS
jgi:hypothetical protein